MFAPKHESSPLVLFGALAVTTTTTLVLAMLLLGSLNNDKGSAPDAAPQEPASPEPTGPTPAPTAPTETDDDRPDDATPDEPTDETPNGGSGGETPIDNDGSGDGDVVGEIPDVAPAAQFTIGGVAPTMLEPGTSSVITMTFTNPHDYAIAVTDVGVTISRVIAPRATATLPCGIRDFAITQSAFSSAPVISSSSEASLSQLLVPEGEWATIAMLNSANNQDGCKASTIELAFTAKAVQR